MFLKTTRQQSFPPATVLYNSSRQSDNGPMAGDHILIKYICLQSQSWPHSETNTFQETQLLL